jgi:hypothetical protein
LVFKPKKVLVFIVAVFISLLPVSAPAATGVINGKVTHGGVPVAHAWVYAAQDPKGLFDAPAEKQYVVTDDEGKFTLTLPKGYYYVAAVMKNKPQNVALAPGDWYSYYGGNPVAVDPARPAGLTLSLVEKLPVAEDDRGGKDPGGVEGKITFDGAPLDGAIIYVYLDANDSFRGMGYYMSPPTGVDGSFKLRMNEGTYYILARKRMKGGVAGPLREGDYFGYLDINPVVVHKGLVQVVDLPMVRKVERASPGGQGKTLLQGTIKDVEGNPVPFVYACVYKNSAMTDRPAFLSKPSGPDGTFTVELPLGGTFYLGARDTIGGPVEPGQLYGRYDGNPEHKVDVETGKTVDGLVIVVEKTE